MKSPLKVGLVCRSKSRFYLRDNVASANNKNPVAKFEVESFDFANVVKSCVLNSNASDHLWSNTSNRCDRTCSTGLPIDFEQNRCRFFRWEFPCQSPSWMMGCGAQSFSLSKVIKFENNTIDFKFIRRTFHSPFVGKFNHFFLE